jgi:hypothetical protein
MKGVAILSALLLSIIWQTRPSLVVDEALPGVAKTILQTTRVGYSANATFELSARGYIVLPASVRLVSNPSTMTKPGIYSSPSTLRFRANDMVLTSPVKCVAMGHSSGPSIYAIGDDLVISATNLTFEGAIRIANVSILEQCKSRPSHCRVE